MGDKKDPFIFLQDHEAPINPEDSSFAVRTTSIRATTKKRKMEQNGQSFDSGEPCLTGDSGSSSDYRTPQQKKQSKLDAGNVRPGDGLLTSPEATSATMRYQKSAKVLVCSNHDLAFIKAVKMTQQKLVQVYNTYLAEQIKFHKVRDNVPQAVFVEPHYTQPTLTILKDSFAQVVQNEILIAQQGSQQTLNQLDDGLVDIQVQGDKGGKQGCVDSLY